MGCRNQVLLRVYGMDEAGVERFIGLYHSAGMAPFKRSADTDDAQQEPA